jgi:hypothetical protein
MLLVPPQEEMPNLLLPNNEKFLDVISLDVEVDLIKILFRGILI